MAIPPAAAAMSAGAASGAASDPGDTSGGDSGSNILVTITGNGDGTFTVYAGPAPDDSGMDTSPDDASAMGAAADATAPQGTPASSVGAALKAAMDILNGGSGDDSGAEGQFAAGFGGAASPGPVAQKY